MSGAQRARLVSTERTPPFIDGQIAAVAATNGLTLVTANTADFQHFAGLHVIDWRS
jgi:tRNA(fMet)-specific endonuclease VapC